MNNYNRSNVKRFKFPMYRVGIYCRLSKDDELLGESASIANQRDYLYEYCASKELEVYKVYSDDGYTGLNMNRPGFQEMLADIDAGQINMIVTKDMSRLGRNRLEVGHLLDEYFPKNNIRYVAVNDSVDTSTDDDDMAPFRSLFNEMYSKDISKKVHSSYYLRATQGMFTGTVAPYGYIKNPDNPHQLIIDEETAQTVRDIFHMAHLGHGTKHICYWLENNKRECPSWWNRQRGLRNQLTKFEVIDPENGRYVWDQSVVRKMIENPVYYGATASQRCYTKFKIGKIGTKPKDEWVTVENTHEAYVTKEYWDEIQAKISERKLRYHKDYENSLFAGLVRCKECGGCLVRRYTHTTKAIKTPYYACKTYGARGAAHCTQHRIDHDVLYDIVLKKIREYGKKALKDKEKVLEKLAKANNSNNAISEIKKLIIRDEERLAVIESIMSKLYEDVVNEKISFETFTKLASKNDAEMKELTSRLEKNKASIEDISSTIDSTSLWLDEISKYSNLKVLDFETLHHIINKIEVSEKIDEYGDRHISLTIFFNMRSFPEPEIKVN